jgi:Glycosyl hydrolases family 16
MLVFEDDFDGPGLDSAVWFPHYLPHWSSRAATAARYEIADSCLRLHIPPDQGLWCGDDHKPPLRVSGIQSGEYSGPLGSTVGQQPYRDGLRVREEQQPFWGWTPEYGRIELHARAELSPRSMVSLWMVGLEDRPDRCAEICVMEVFGNALEPGQSAAVGMGLHQFRDPATPEDFEAVPLDLDVAEFHTYAVTWTPEQAAFAVDGRPIRSCPRPPQYPMQLMLAVFDFPDWSTGTDDDLSPAFVIDWVRGQRD